MWIPDGCVPVLVVSCLAIISLGLTKGESCGALVTATDGENLNELMSRAFTSFRRACRKKENDQHHIIKNCSFVTEATPGSDRGFTFILKPLVPPFRLSFGVKAPNKAVILLARERTIESVFAEIIIRNGHDVGAFIRTCYSGNTSCNKDSKPAESYESGLVSSAEFRSFWVGIVDGVITVGKGDDDEDLMVWNAGVRDQEVHVGIATYGEMERGDWVFHAFCE